MTAPVFYFFIFAFIALVCGLGVLVSRHPITAAVSLIGTMISLAGIYGLLASPFLGVVQILVYAGAIMMLVVFVIMMLNCARDDAIPRSDKLALGGMLLPVVVVFAILGTLRQANLSPAEASVEGTIDALAAVMFNFGDSYWVLFEVIGVALLVALTAAVLLAKKPSAIESESQEDAE